MLASIFRKSTPINYTLIVIIVLLMFFLYQIQDLTWTLSYIEIGKKIGILALIYSTLFFINFIVKKNILTKDSVYTVYFFILLLLFFPSVLNNWKLLLANFFIILSMRRLISLQTLKAPKEKIFDATLWILVASLLHFWCILFLLLVYISIIFNVSRDYKNWLIPIAALLAFGNLFLLYALAFDEKLLSNITHNFTYNFEIDYFKNKYQNIAFSSYVVAVIVFVISAIFSLSSRPLNLQGSYKKIIFAFIIAIAIFILSPQKSNEILLFTFFPLAVMMTNFVEYSQNKINQEMVLYVTTFVALFNYFMQL